MIFINDATFALLWPLSPTSAPTWAALSVVLFTIWIAAFWLTTAESPARKRLHAEKKKKNEDIMAVILACEADSQDLKQEQKLPESDRVLALLWDDVHEQPTSAYGIDPHLTARTEKLFRRVIAHELARAVDITQEARQVRYASTPCLSASDQTKNSASSDQNQANKEQEVMLQTLTNKEDKERRGHRVHMFKMAWCNTCFCSQRITELRADFE